ncbi:alpha/beta hydrolase [Pseudonocardia sp. Cha107L01]|uniref:alpha/beta hydrolase n=1 Tax=Pseudonocardia sp. Cha107L01 TaxID=3457576 RepID=UPI00403E8820
MSSATSPDTPLSWDEPPGLAPRGTVVVLAGRGERPGVYERFGRRLAADAYRVRAVGDATADAGVEAVSLQVKSLLEEPGRPGPLVLAGSDTGALLALRLVALGSVTVDGLILAGLPDPTLDTALDTGPDTALDTGPDAVAEPELRASCPAHQKLLRDADRDLFQTGALTRERIPAELREPIEDTAAGVAVPVLGLHGDNDQLSPLAQVRARYTGLPHAELLTVADGRHDVLNAANHRSVAASVVLWLERLRLGAGLPPIVTPVPGAGQVPA